MSPPDEVRRARDGSPYPSRDTPEFQRDVRAMFTHIADRYDWFDHLASLGQDYLWRPRALWTVDRYRRRRPIGRVLDIGCGPGELTFLVAGRAPGAEVVGSDVTAAMLRNAHLRAVGSSTGARVRLVRADGGRLPFRDASFDLVMSAFVARNLPSLPVAFREFRRVLRSGGTVFTLEITEPVSPMMNRMFHSYFDHVVPWLGKAVQSEGPYRYLPESLRHLPDRSGMLRMMQEAGFGRTVAEAQSFGIVTTYLGEAGKA
ncbi:MAG TPA: ubiquinone/menaquinone biosynthesis methyltransferase [Thermoplasmata archaeon]|nr:ubiquinone/menaquinone biosynthesis methyltransferase [Thermoplasmata archaeon]